MLPGTGLIWDRHDGLLEARFHELLAMAKAAAFMKQFPDQSERRRGTASIKTGDVQPRTQKPGGTEGTARPRRLVQAQFARLREKAREAGYCMRLVFGSTCPSGDDCRFLASHGHLISRSRDELLKELCGEEPQYADDVQE
eukprot:scaffold6656_cov149-Pinguiococcus_pyrenoidosus.AAC.1